MFEATNWAVLPLEDVRPGVSRRVFSGEKATVCLNYLQPGHEPKPHSHPHEQIVYIVEGRCEFHVGPDVVSMGPGDLLTIPGGITHHLVVVGADTVVNVDVFSPRRDEYVRSPQAGPRERSVPRDQTSERSEQAHGSH